MSSVSIRRVVMSREELSQVTENGANGVAQRKYSGRSAEQRRAERRRLLLDAAKELWREGGMSALSVRAVAARAKLTDRYFYEQFAGLSALIGAVIDDVVEGPFAAMIEAGGTPDSATVQTRLTRGLAAFIEHAENDPLAVRIFLTDARHIESVAEQIRVAQHRVAAAILTYLQPDRDADPKSFDAALFCVGGVTALLNERVLDSSKTVTAQDFAAQAVAWCARILQADEEPGAPG
jgi:AcrR family transcriptional regulator